MRSEHNRFQKICGLGLSAMRESVRDRLSSLSQLDPLWLVNSPDWATVPQIEAIDCLVVSVGWVVDQTAFARLPNLRHIAVYGSSFARIDVAEAERRGIILSSIKDYCDPETAEYVIAMLMAHVRCVSSPATSEPRSLLGKRLGLLGYGGVARQVAKRARGLDMDVVYTRRSVGDPAEQPAGYVPVDVLLEISDIVSVHVPAGVCVLGVAELAKLRLGAIIVNVCVGETIEREALRRWLEAGRGHLLLDAVSVESYPELAGHEAVIVSPNPAYRTVDSLARRDELLFNNLARALAATA